MHFWDTTFITPAENLACEEALLEWCEAGHYQGPGILRFWEAREYFVVLGYANKYREEVNEEYGQAKRIPVLRRCSGGGTVLQGPGCLNYALVLPIAKDARLAGITETNRFIMQRHAEVLTKSLGKPVTTEGHTDLAIGERKFSGNSQRRKREWVLFHGTFLIDFDLEMIAKALLPPPRQPDYRKGRSHLDFVTRLNCPRTTIFSALKEAWDVKDPLTDSPLHETSGLAREKYSSTDWNLKW